MYEHYKNARNKSWEVLIACGINSLPVDLWKIAKHFDLHIHPYSKTNLIGLLKEDVSQGDGFIVYLDGKKEIFINDKIHCRKTANSCNIYVLYIFHLPFLFAWQT